jgi:hypothetical protein
LTTTNRQQSLAAARRACGMLAPYALGEYPVAYLADQHRELIACLIEEFSRLDAARSRSGRPRIETDNPKTLAQRRWRDKRK